VRDNEILLNAKAGVEIRSGSDPVIEKNKLAKVCPSVCECVMCMLDHMLVCICILRLIQIL
jgi:hypothetical protein